MTQSQFLRSRTAIVVGASSGIWEALARALDREGWRLALLARRGNRLEAIARELQPGTVARRVWAVVVAVQAISIFTFHILRIAPILRPSISRNANCFRWVTRALSRPAPALLLSTKWRSALAHDCSSAGAASTRSR